MFKCRARNRSPIFKENYTLEEFFILKFNTRAFIFQNIQLIKIDLLKNCGGGTLEIKTEKNSKIVFVEVISLKIMLFTRQS